MIQIGFFLLMLTGSLTAHSSRYCNSGDMQVGSNWRTESQACTQPGYCRAYGYNPATGKYEYYYGHHSSCPGQRERRIEETFCQRPDGSRYTVTDTGFWSGCNIR